MRYANIRIPIVMHAMIVAWRSSERPLAVMMQKQPTLLHQHVLPFLQGDKRCCWKAVAAWTEKCLLSRLTIHNWSSGKCSIGAKFGFELFSKANFWSVIWMIETSKRQPREDTASQKRQTIDLCSACWQMAPAFNCKISPDSLTSKEDTSERQIDYVSTLWLSL